MSTVGYLGYNSVSTFGAGSSHEGMLSVQSTAPQPSVRVPLPVAGHLGHLSVNVISNSLNGNLVVTVWVNGVATTLTVTYAAGVTGFLTSSGPVAVSANDVVSINFDATAATTGSYQLTVGLEYLT